MMNFADMLADSGHEYDDLKKLMSRYKLHRRGFFILGPSGVGKTTFIERQTPADDGKYDWLDADDLWYATHALPDKSTQWWRNLKPNGPFDIVEIESRCDEITDAARKMGLRLMGSSCDAITPDAIVIPDWETHLMYIKTRESNAAEYARLGGARSDKLDQLKKHIDIISRWQERGVPRFKSVKDAVNYLQGLDNE